MKFFSSLLAVNALALLSHVVAQADDTPELTIQTTFPNDAFARVTNGQANRVVFTISPPRSGPDSDRILTLEGIAGAFLNRDKVGKKGYVMRNVSVFPTALVSSYKYTYDKFLFEQMTMMPYASFPLKPKDGKPLQVPYDFYPEFKPQSIGVEFRLTVKDSVSVIGKVRKMEAH
jgi:hypothetical protein